MQSLYNNQDLLFKDVQDFLFRKQHVPEKRLPYCLRWVSRFHEFCNRQNIEDGALNTIAAYVQDRVRAVR